MLLLYLDTTGLRTTATKSSRFAWLFAAGLAASIPCGALAAPDPNSLSLSPEELLDATVVSVSRKQEKLMDAAAAIYVLTGEDIIRSGATSIPDALRLVPGVEVAQVNANSWAVSMRGFNGALNNKLLVLIDGRAVYDPLFSGVYWDVQDLVLEDIDRIEVIRGPGSTLWGANAVNGVINIITKKSSDTQGNLASVTVGNQDNIVELRNGGKLSDDNGYYRIYTKYLDRRSEDTLSGINDRDGQEEERGGFRSDWKGNGDAKDDFTFQGDIYHSGTGQYRTTPIFNTTATKLNLEDITADGANLLGRWNRTFSDDAHLMVQSYVDYTLRDQLLLSDRRSTFDLDTQYQFPDWGRHEFITGAGYRYSADYLGIDTPLTKFDSIGERTEIFSGFVQDKITLVPKSWFLTLGSKLEHNDYTGFEVEPNARLQWHIDDDQMAWASVSRAVRTPSRLEEAVELVQAAAPSASLDTVPNRSLDSEKLTAYELGYRQQWTPKVSVDLATFYNVYYDLSIFNQQGFFIGSNPIRLVLPLVPVNAESARSYGEETTLNWHALPNWNLSGSYSWMILNVSSGVSGANAIDNQTPVNELKLRSQWDITKTVSFDTMLYYDSGLQAFSVRDSTRLDTRLAWKIVDGVEASLVGQDLLEPQRHEFAATTSPQTFATEIGRSVYGNVTWRF